MATESGARHRDNQNAFRITDVKKRKKLLGKVLEIPEFNEEDDWRLLVDPKSPFLFQDLCKSH